MMDESDGRSQRPTRPHKMKNETGNSNSVVPHNQAPVPPRPQSSVRRMSMEIHLPPKKQFKLLKHRSALGAKRRRKAELEKERARKERMRKAREIRMMSMSDKNGVGGIAGRKHAAKKAKRGRAANNSTI